MTVTSLVILAHALLAAPSVGTGLIPGAGALGWWRSAGPPPAEHHAQPPHPAVARIIVPERGATSYGSGTLIDVRDRFGLVVTNWHVVQDASDKIEVVFPDGFRSYARALKLDRDWDLAALVIWRPNVSPVKLAPTAPRPGDVLTIAGYGQGTYRAATGRCTQYLAPKINLPQEMVEVNVQARQGDSGGPIFNDRGELAGVLFGAGSGTTMGSYAGRVGGFLTSLAPDLGKQEQLVAANPQPPAVHARPQPPATPGIAPQAPVAPQPSLSGGAVGTLAENPPRRETETAPLPIAADSAAVAAFAAPVEEPVDTISAESNLVTWIDMLGPTPFEQAKSILAILGSLAVLMTANRIWRATGSSRA